MAIRKLISASEAVDRMISGAANAAGRWEDGIANPRASFKTAALGAEAKHTARTQEALAEHRYAKGMAQVNEADAIATALAVGGASISQGMEARRAKIHQRMTKYFSLLGPHIDAMDKLPTTTTADADKKVLKNLEGMREIGKKMRA